MCRKDELEMDMAKFQARHQWVRDELRRCVDFWLKHGMDHEHGGVYTCLDRTGRSTPPTKAFGCRAAAAGCLPTSAPITA